MTSVGEMRTPEPWEKTNVDEGNGAAHVAYEVAKIRRRLPGQSLRSSWANEPRKSSGAAGSGGSLTALFALDALDARFP